MNGEFQTEYESYYGVPCTQKKFPLR